jgi:2',3'-cyclic-nucleotide 2'-phosphodiesterase (5'-nucleotidase family)
MLAELNECGVGPQVVGESAVDLDGRFATVRTQESNLGNFVADVFREASRADVALLNSGSLRSDIIHPAGPVTARVCLTFPTTRCLLNYE